MLANLKVNLTIKSKQDEKLAINHAYT